MGHLCLYKYGLKYIKKKDTSTGLKFSNFTIFDGQKYVSKFFKKVKILKVPVEFEPQLLTDQWWIL